nr:MAG TPA: hypothetical protein [Caudoviricetes sp.]
MFKGIKKEPPVRLPHVKHAGDFTLAESGGVLQLHYTFFDTIVKF